LFSFDFVFDFSLFPISKYIIDSHIIYKKISRTISYISILNKLLATIKSVKFYYQRINMNF